MRTRKLCATHGAVRLNWRKLRHRERIDTHRGRAKSRLTILTVE